MATSSTALNVLLVLFLTANFAVTASALSVCLTSTSSPKTMYWHANHVHSFTACIVRIAKCALPASKGIGWGLTGFVRPVRSPIAASALPTSANLALRGTSSKIISATLVFLMDVWLAMLKEFVWTVLLLSFWWMGCARGVQWATAKSAPTTSFVALASKTTLSLKRGYARPALTITVPVVRETLGSALLAWRGSTFKGKSAKSAKFSIASSAPMKARLLYARLVRRGGSGVRASAWSLGSRGGTGLCWEWLGQVLLSSIVVIVGSIIFYTYRCWLRNRL